MRLHVVVVLFQVSELNGVKIIFMVKWTVFILRKFGQLFILYCIEATVLRDQWWLVGSCGGYLVATAEC
jgi:hypothetical protein